MTVYDDDHPEVIRARAEATVKKLEARAKLHPVAQAIYALFDSVTNFVTNLGCLLIILVVVLLFFGAPLLELIKAVLGN